MHDRDCAAARVLEADQTAQAWAADHEDSKDCEQLTRHWKALVVVVDGDGCCGVVVCSVR